MSGVTGSRRQDNRVLLLAMKRTEYLDDPHVRGFLDWAAPLAAGTRPLRHRWQSPRWDSWSCETLFGAYRAYNWSFRCVLPGSSVPRCGCSLP